MVIVGGQSIVAWALRYDIQIPKTETPYLTQDVDFFAIAEDARWLAQRLNGRLVTAKLGEITPNAATLVITSIDGETDLFIDFLLSVLGLKDDEIRGLAVPMQFGDHPPVHVLHPLLCLESRFENLYRLSAKRDGNGITQAHVAIQIISSYLDDLLSQGDYRQAYKAAQRIMGYCCKPAALFCYATYGLDPVAAIQPEAFPNPAFAEKNWPHLLAKVLRKRRLDAQRRARFTGVSFSPRP